MKELEICSLNSLDKSELKNYNLLLLDESEITCTNIEKIRSIVSEYSENLLIGMYEDQIEKGLRGYVKAQILLNLEPDKIGRILSLKKEEIDSDNGFGGLWKTYKELGIGNWQNNQITNRRKEDDPKLEVGVTNDKLDVDFIKLAMNVRLESNCWLDPAGCVFSDNNKLLVAAASMSFNRSNCKNFPFRFNELALKPGERMYFCDSLHAEMVGISDAAKKGISLNGSTVYITKFPCRQCMQGLVAAGVKRIVYYQDSYGLKDAGLLKDNQVELRKVVF